MVRSKFPGKPSKIVNRKIVNSSKYTLQHENESTKAAENISYGLAVFNEVFGDNDQVLTAFHGFSPHEVDHARDIARKQWDEVVNEYNSSGVIHKPEDAIPIRLDPPTPQALSQMEANFDLMGPVGKHTRQVQNQNSSFNTPLDYSKSVSPSKYFSPFKGNLKKHVANRLLQRAKRSSLDGSSIGRMRLNAQLDKNGTVNATNALRKFVLPSHSLRSSRVIKPNKRFLDTEDNTKEESSQLTQSDSPSRSRTIELKKPRLILDSTNDFHVLKSLDLKCNPSDVSFTSHDGNICLATQTVNSGAGAKQQWKHVKLGELNVFGAPTIQPTGSKCPKTINQGDKKVSPQTVLSVKASPVTAMLSTSSKSKLVLRESKLSVSTSSEKLQEGLFSRKPKKGLAIKSPASPVECEVCGTIRFYRLANRAHKFGINSCEPCRKFVARMIIKARSSENSVSCEKGQGNCAMTFTSSKNESIATKIHKCLACWLLMCIQRFVSMPEQTRDSLIRMLPANMQGMTVIVPTTSPYVKSPTSLKQKRSKTTCKSQSLSGEATGFSPLSPGKKKASQTAMSRMRRKAALASLANNLRLVREKTASSSLTSKDVARKNVPVGRKLLKAEKTKKIGHLKRSRTLPKTAEKPGRKSGNRGMERAKDGSLRQKLTLNGPRVKHVCRSASIVLGQPVATFPLKSASSPSNPVSTSQPDIGSLPEYGVTSDFPKNKSAEITDLATKNEPQKLFSTTSESRDSSIDQPTASTSITSESEKKVSSRALSNSSTVSSVGARRVSVLPPNAMSNFSSGVMRGHRRTLQALSIYNTQLDSVPELVSLDFWESYDLDEVCNTGFGLIGFEPLGCKPVCFLCGSAGKQKLIHCASCCEPYHQFCVEMGVVGNPLPPVSSVSSGRDEWRVDWVCPRCTVCHGCGRSTGHQLTSCQRCHNSYHVDCLGLSSLRKNTGDRLWICSSCLRCKSCNSTCVTKFVGNLPFCKVCFKLRQKGNFCPLCQGCYTDDDYQSEMMECAECKAWVHAKCEGLSDEKYQVLSYLPESVEYVCRLCCASPPAPWWLAVEAELQAGYLNILKAITKNRKACAMLKWSPRKACICQQNSLSTLTKVSIPGISLGKRRLSFNLKGKDMEIQIPPTVSIVDTEQADAESLCSVKGNPSVFEFDDDIDAGENLPITKYVNSKERSKTDSSPEFSMHQEEFLNEGGDNPSKGVQFSPNTGSQSDSGIGSTDDELKTCSAAEEEDVAEKVLPSSSMVLGNDCICSPQSQRPSASSLLTVKKKVHSSEYSSLLEFHQDMDQLISEADSHEVKELYHQTLQEVFPWFDPKYTRVSRNSLPNSPCKPYHGSLLQHQQSSPDKSSGYLSSIKLLENLIPKDGSKLDDSYFYIGMNIKDERICCFCKLSGDSAPNEEGRLLYCGQNDWVHVNCALWSAEVFEEIDGALQNVSNALSRGRMIRCSVCGKKGASVGCCAKKCEETLHFPCARKSGFVFMEDKNVYCSLHKKDAPGKPLVKSSEFDIARPVFVELDRRKKKSIESKHVRLMIGSLYVESLGTIVPEVSDQGSIIIPTQFNCTRLFWSSKEPWRIVQYRIRTTVHLPAPEPVLDLGHHVTVDHSKENVMSNDSQEETVNLRSKKFKSAEAAEDVRIECGTSEFSLQSDDTKIVEAVVSHLLDTVCNKEVDEEVSDAQNSADLLPPELKDAIFEDLPHDFLDGISMQDIFQDKFLSFEEGGKDDVQEEEGGCESGVGGTKEPSSKEKSKIVKSLRAVRELKRSKSDVLPNSSSQITDRLHQRSCSLAWSCKLGTSVSCCKATKGRSQEGVVDRTQLIQELRLSVKPAPNVGLRYHIQEAGDKGKENHSLSWPRIMQVDGACDLSSSDNSDIEDFMSKDSSSILSAPKVTPERVGNFEPLWNKIDTLQKIPCAALFRKAQVISAPLDGRTHPIGRCKWRRGLTKMFRRRSSHDSTSVYFPQLDGAADVSSDSEHDVPSDVSCTQHGDEKPVRCDRCGCTYRTSESYARHLPSCTGDYSLTTSESEADVSEDEAGSNKRQAPGLDHILAPSPDSAISISSGSLISVPSVSPTSSGGPPVPVASTVAVHATSDAQSLTSITTAATTASLTLNNIESEIRNQAEPIFTASESSHVISVEQVSTSSCVGSQVSAFSGVLDCVAKTKCPEPIHGITVEQANVSSVSQTVQPSQQPTSVIMLDYQQSQQSGPTVFVQSVPSAAMVPTFLEAYQQQSGHNLQYLATVDTNGGFGKTQYLAAVPSAVVPGAYQLQAMSDGQLCVDPCTMGISTLPGIHLTQAPLSAPQPQVLGTLIQSSLPCGVVTTAEPMYETLQMYPDQSGGVLLASQPMLTCMETVVSNTYMSMASSQFVSSSVPSRLEGNRSYSATATQVYQAGEVDSSLIDVPTQYVMVNSQARQNGSEIEVISLNQHNIQEQSSVQTQSQIQIPSINLPIPASLSAPISPQTLPPVIPTSVVPPMPRLQPQRTYSKPTKINREVQANGIGGFSSATSAKQSTTKSSKDKKLLQLNNYSIKVLTTQGHQTHLVSHPVQQNKHSSSNISYVKPASMVSKAKKLMTEPALSPSEFIATNIAPTQSITLPDPIPKLTVDEGHPVENTAGEVGGASGRCPPLTFSCRPTVVKAKQLVPVFISNSTSLQSPSVEVVGKKTSMRSENLQLRANELSPSIIVSTSQEPKRAKEFKTLKILSSASITKPSSSTGNGKPVATIIPQTQARTITVSSSVSQPISSSIVSGGLAVSNTTAPIVKMCSGLANQSLSSKIPSTKKAPSTPKGPPVPGSVCRANPLLASLIANTSNSTQTSSVSHESVSTLSSTAHTASISGTTTTFSSPKPVVSTVTGLKPLQEIKTANLKNVEGNSSSSKCHEKLLISVPPLVLKTACHNYDLTTKNDLLNKQGLSVAYVNGDKSPSSLKLVFQKQAQNGCYKVCSSMVNKEDDILLKLGDPAIVPMSHKKGGKDESENVQPIANILRKTTSNPAVPHLLFEIRGQDGFSYSSTSISDMWQKVFDAVQKARAKHKMPPLLHNPFESPESAPNLLGLGNNSLKYLMEQLRRVEDCTKYRPIYHKSRLPGPAYRREDLDSAFKESSSGCARTDPCMALKKYDMFSWLDSRHRCPPKLLENNDFDSLPGGRRSASTNLPMAMRFRHLRETSKTSVGVFRSDIHGRGLFCLRDIEAGEMVIEYAGEVIRNTLTDNRERYYQSKGIDCYMFKVDDNFTVDATQKGNAARFINHSCEPNCYSRVVDIHGKKHIVIFAYRRIPQGEELTYDYKFPIEDVKIACHCLAPRCRKYLN